MSIHAKKMRGSISGLSILLTLGLWILSGAVVGIASWFGVSSLGESWQKANIPILLVVAEAYALLPIVIFFVYGGLVGLQNTIKLRFTSISDIWLALRVWLVLMVGLLLLYMVLGVAASGSIWSSGLGLIQNATDMARFSSANALAWILILIRVFLLAGLLEELLFRGVLFGWLRQRFSAKTTIITTTILFTAMHYYLVIFPAAFVYGIVAGWLREKTGSVLPSLIVHILTDGTLFFIAYFLTVYRM